MCICVYQLHSNPNAFNFTKHTHWTSSLSLDARRASDTSISLHNNHISEWQKPTNYSGHELNHCVADSLTNLEFQYLNFDSQIAPGSIHAVSVFDFDVYCYSTTCLTLGLLLHWLFSMQTTTSKTCCIKTKASHESLHMKNVLIRIQILYRNIVAGIMPYPLPHVAWFPSQTHCSMVTLRSWDFKFTFICNFRPLPNVFFF